MGTRSSSEDRSSGTLGRSHNSRERQVHTLERKSSHNNYEELQLLLDELHTNVRQAKDIQAKINNTMMSYEDIDQLPPPPPPRTSSRLSLADDVLLLPPPQIPSAFPPKPEMPPKSAMDNQKFYRTRNLPPIAPKPNSIITMPPKNSYGTLPNPGKLASKIQRSKSGRRISFDTNIQLIEDANSISSDISKKNAPFRGTISSEPSATYIGAVSTCSSTSLPTDEPLYTAVVKPHGRMSRYPATGCCVPSQSSSPAHSSHDIYSSLQQPHAEVNSFKPQPSHSSVPSSPQQNSRLWGSFRGKKPPPIDKRTFSPYLKTLS